MAEGTSSGNNLSTAIRPAVESPDAASSAPELGARSVVLSLDPEGKQSVGLRLKDLEDEVQLPELQLGVEKYRVLGVLGEGGMGKVYLVYDQDLSRKVALKVVKRDGSQQVWRFLEEAKVMAQLEHPNIVPVYEVGMTEGKKLYYTMPVVRGRTLKDVLEALSRGEAKMARRLIKFMRGGNRYQGGVTACDGSTVKLIIRETYQDPKFVGKPSFAMRRKREVEFRPYTKESLLSREIEVFAGEDDDEEAMVATPAADDLEEGMHAVEDEAEPVDFTAEADSDGDDEDEDEN